MEPGENIYSFLCIYDHIIVGIMAKADSLSLPIDALIKLLSLLSVLADLSQSHEVRRRSCSFLPIVGVGLFWLLFALHCSCTSTLSTGPCG